MRDHLRLHPKNAERRSKGVALRALAAANPATKSTASWLHLPPVSRTTTTRRQRSPCKSSAYLRSLSSRVLPLTAPQRASSVVQREPRSEDFYAFLTLSHWKISFFLLTLEEVCTFRVLGLLCEAPAAPKPPGLYTTAIEPKHAHLRVPTLQRPPKFNEKTPQRGKNRTNFAAGEGKRSVFFGRSWGRAVLGVSWVGSPGGLQGLRGFKPRLTTSSPLNPSPPL